MSKQVISNDKHVLKPHNSPAVVVPGLVFASGQVGHGEIAEATREAMGNLKEVLELAGSSFSKVVKFNIYMRNLEEMGAMNEVFVALLPEGPKPARTCIQAGRLPGYQKNAAVEIEAIAQV